MNIVYKVIYPVPKLNWQISDYEDEIIFIPVFKHLNFLNIYNEVINKKNKKNKNKLKNKFNQKDLQSFLNIKKNNNYNNKIPGSYKNLINNSKNFINHYKNITKNKWHCSQQITTCKDDNDNLNKLLLKNNLVKYIPCMYLKYDNSNNLLIYFHANSEDLGMAYYLLNLFKNNLNMNILCIEYPNYSIYKSDKKICEKLIYEDSKNVIDFWKIGWNINLENVILCGRSIGSAQVCYLSKLYKFGFCCWVSPFLSIKKILLDFGTIGKLGKLFISQNLLENERHIKDSINNFLLIHGKIDNIINYEHSDKLNLWIKNYCMYYLFDKINHNDFDPIQFIINPIINYILKFKYIINNNDSNINKLGDLLKF